MAYHRWKVVGEPHPIERCSRCCLVRSRGPRLRKGGLPLKGENIEYSTLHGEVIELNPVTVPPCREGLYDDN